jgi:HAD superfamily hydrolase (TIGR01509 family)
MTKLKALLFDVDGTLADTERDGHRVAFNQAFADAGLAWDWTPELYGKLLKVTGGKERIRYYLTDFIDHFDYSGDLDELIVNLHRSKTAHYLEMLKAGAIPLRPGVARLLDEARGAELRLGIATTTTPENVTYLLEATLGAESIGWFDVIAAGDIVPAKKPAADIFHHALEELGLEPDDCVAFEDSENGLKASLGAGVPTIVTVNDYTRAQDFDGAMLVVSDMGEPEQPFEVLAGNAGDSGWVDVALVRRLAGDC